MEETVGARRWGWPRGPLVVLAFAVGVGVRLSLLALPARYATDVSYYNAQAVGYLFRGVDPYGAAYSVPPPLATPGAGKIFAYLPGVFSFTAPAGAVWGTALGLVAADLVVAWALLKLGRNRGWACSALFLLFPPTVLFSTYFPNDSLPAIAFLSLALVAESRGSRRAGALLWGLAFASSLEAWLLFPFYLALSLRRRDYGGPVLAALAATAFVAPFAAWGPSSFFEDAILFQFRRGASALVSSGPFGLNVNPSLQGILLSAGTSAPLVARGALAAAALALCLWRFRHGLEGLALGGAVFTAVALFLVAGDLFWAYLELPLALLLAWGALRGGPARFNA